MEYKRNYHGIIRIMLDLFYILLIVAARPGRIMEDSIFFKKLVKYTHTDPLVKDYLKLWYQLYINNPSYIGYIMPNNLSGLNNNIPKK